MIFAKEYIKKICDGEKTQTRRINRGIYKVGKTYTIQPCRICKGIENYRIMMDWIWEETVTISNHDARMEGGYTALIYEQEFRKIYPKWDGMKRWAYKFHMVEATNGK